VVPNILILFAHPAFEKSRINRRLIEAVSGVKGVTFNDLYENYPEFDVDVRREQELLLDHDVIVLQYPFYWYSTPALFKQWQDLVLRHGWAYGSGGTALKGKIGLSAITTGGSEEAYQTDGHNHFTMQQLLAPIQQTANLCGMEHLPPFVVHGTHSLSTDQVTRHANDYRRVIEGLRDGILDFEKARRYPRLNWNLQEILPRVEGAG
jgi:glutathione-regulated potassium-efflux system ancillary protein KefG